MKTLNKVFYVSVLLGITLFIFNFGVTLADDNPQRTCGTMAYHEYLMQTDPLYAQNRLEVERFTSEYILNPAVWEDFEKRGIIIIPVVVHVVYNTPSQNISDAQIQSQIDVLNEDYRKLNADVSNVPNEFKPLVADAKIQFQLAARDPNCNATNGITRTSTTVTSFGYTGNPVKYASSGGHDAWPSDKYLNLWVCHLSGSLLGYAQFPGGPAATDGVVIDFEAFGNIGTAAWPFDLGRTATHEIGHWLNLRHIWGDDGGACTGSDLVADTPNQGGEYYGCPAHPQTSCSSHDMFMNFMDYVDDRCMLMFTEGQSVRMDAILFGTRSSILGSAGHIPPTAGGDLWAQDEPDDIGNEPNTISSVMWRSDDIWVRNQDDYPVNLQHQDPEYNPPSSGLHNYVYVRVRNRGCVDPGATVKLYWAKASTGLSWPYPWDGSTAPLYGGEILPSQSSGSVAGSEFTVVKFQWDPPNPALYASFGADKGHFCLLARIDPPNMTFAEGADLNNNVRNNNNIIWKNVEVVDLIIPRFSHRSFIMRNPHDSIAEVDMEFKLPGRVKNFIDVEIDLSSFFPWNLPGTPQFVGMTVNPATGLAFMTDSIARIENMLMEPQQMLVIGVEPKPRPGWRFDGQVRFSLDAIQYSNNSTTPDGGMTYEITAGPKPAIHIEKTHNTYQGQYEYVSITLEDYPLEMGGFDFLIGYDASALTFAEAEPGQLLEDCDWEYFTYRYGVHGNCDNACPSGLLRIIAMAETNDGSHHPSCYGPPDTDPHELARMKFLVSNDRNYNGQYVPIYFFWDDCGDNSISSVDGEVLYTDHAIYDFEENLIWNEDDDDEFPEDERIPFVGAPDYCLNPDPDKPSAIRCVDFIHGGIDIIPSEFIDARGDVNLNGVAYEIADAVVFTNFFIYGYSAFTVNVAGQIAATEINGDGTVLTVADLVYLIRVILGNAPPIPKLTPFEGEAMVSMLVNHSASAVATNSPVEIGAAQFIIEHQGYILGEPHLINGASDMTLIYNDKDGVLKVLVYSLEAGRTIEPGPENIFIVPIDGEGSMRLREVQLADNYGSLLSGKIDADPLLPTDFVLHQNYPNPFNSETQIVYELPQTANVRIEILNTLGQNVAILIDREETAGVHRVSWNGTDFNGNSAASGIYIYRFEAAGNVVTKKMTLLK